MIRAALLASLVLLTAAAAAARPLRVMSINVCSDQYLLALLPPARIASVEWLSRDPSLSIMAAAAARVPVNHGAAEEVLRDRPDLVIAGSYTTPATRLLLQRLRLPVMVVQPADSFDGVRRETRAIAAAVGEPARGEALIARMDAILRDLAAERGPPVRVAAWDGAGFGAEPGSMYDALLRAAGARNVAAQANGLSRGAPGVEALLATAPDLLVEGEPGAARPGLHAEGLRNPIVRRRWAGRVVTLPAAYYVCGTPFSADGALKLRGALRAAKGP